jgi:hypothetical protein
MVKKRHGPLWAVHILKKCLITFSKIHTAFSTNDVKTPKLGRWGGGEGWQGGDERTD